MEKEACKVRQVSSGSLDRICVEREQLRELEIRLTHALLARTSTGSLGSTDQVGLWNGI